MEPRTPEPNRSRPALLQKSMTTNLPKKTVPARVFRQPYLRSASYDPFQLAKVDVVQGGEQRRRSLSSLDSRDDLSTKPGSTSRESLLAPARTLPDSPDHLQANPPGTSSSSTTTHLSPHIQERPTSRHGSSNTQRYYIPAGDARGLGIITETSESSASLAALSPRQAITNPSPSVNLQTQTLYKTHLAQGSAIAPLSSPYIPIAEAARKRAVNGLVPKTTTPEVPDAVAGGASYTVAPSSFASSPEISILCDGTLWYLCARRGPPYRWVHCKAILTTTHLELSWNNRDGPSSVELDLLRCRQVRAMPCASHPSARADIGSQAAYEERGASLNLVEDLYPFHITYKDDVERLAAGSVRERIRWVGFILDAITKLESNADRAYTSPMSRPPRLRSLSTGSSYFTASRLHTDGSTSAFSMSMPRFRRGLRHHSRTKSGSDLPTPTEEDPRRKHARIGRTNSMLENPNPVHSLLDQPAPSTSSSRKRKVSNPLNFVTSILGKITPSEDSSGRFFTRSRLLSRRGLDTPFPVLTAEQALAVGSTTKSGGRGSAQEGIQNVSKHKKPLIVFDGLSQAKTAADVPITALSSSYTSGGPQNEPPMCNTSTSGVYLASDSSTLPPPRGSTAAIIDWRSEKTATGAGSSTPVNATTNVIFSISSPPITSHSQPSSRFMTPPQTATQHNAVPGDPPRSRITSTSTIKTANAHESNLHSRSSSNKDLPALPAPLLQTRDDEAKSEPLPLTLEDIIALESPKSWRSLSPQEETLSSVSQPVKTPTKKASITNQPRFPSTFRQHTPQEGWLGQQDSPLLTHSALLHTQNLPVIGSSTPGPTRVTPQEPLGVPLLQDSSGCSTPTPASVRPSSILHTRGSSGSSLSSGALKLTLPLRLSSRGSSITSSTTPTTSGGRNNSTRSVSLTSSRSHRASEIYAPASTLAPDQDPLATIQDTLKQVPRRGVEETHALSEQLERIEQEITELSTFVRQHARSIGLRPPARPVVQVATLDGLARSEPPGGDVINWPVPPIGTGTGGMVSVDSVLTALEAATEASKNGVSEELEDGDRTIYVSDTPLGRTPETWSCPTPPPNTPAPVFTPTSAEIRPNSFSIRTSFPPPSLLGIPDGSPSILDQVTNAQLLGSLDNLRRIMDRFIRRQQITNDTLEDLRGRIPAQQMEGPGVSWLTNDTQVLNHISQSLRTISNQLRMGSGDDPVEVPAPSRSPVALDVQNGTTVSQATPQTVLTPSSPLPQPPIHVARNSTLTTPPSSSSAAYPRIHTINEPTQRLSIWQPRARRVVPRRRVFSEPASSAWQTTSGHRELREQEREQAPGDSGTSSITSRRPSILRSQSPDRTPLSSAQYDTPGKPNVSTSARLMYQRSVSAPVAHEGVSVKLKPKKRSVAWASPVVSDFNPIEASRAKTDFDPQMFLDDDPHEVSATNPLSMDFQEVLQLLREVNLRQATASKQQSEVVRYLTELNGWLGRDLQDRQSEFRGIGSQINTLNALVDKFIHQAIPTFHAVTSRNPQNVQELIEAPQPQDAIHGDTSTPQFANSDVPRPMASTPDNITGTTGVRPRFILPATTSLPRSVVDSTLHDPTPSSIDILADTTQLTISSPASPSLPLPAQGQTGTPPPETSSLTLRVANLTDQDTIISTPSSPGPDATPFQPSRSASAPSPVLVDLESTRDPLLSYNIPHITLASAPASSVGPMHDRDDVSELPRHPSLPSVIDWQSTLSQESLIQPRTREGALLPPSSPSQDGIQAPYLVQPIQTASCQTAVRSVDTFPGNRGAEQFTANTPFSPQLAAVDFPEPSHFATGPVSTPIPDTIALLSDSNPYPHSTIPSSVRSRRAVSSPTSPTHEQGLDHWDTAGRPTPQSMYLNQADSFPIAPIKAPPVALEPYSTVHVQSPQDPNYYSAWLYPPNSQAPSIHENGVVPKPITKRPLPQPVSFQQNQGESWLAPQTILRPEDSISTAGALQGAHGLQAPSRMHQDTSALPPSIVMHPDPDLPFVPAQVNRRPHRAGTTFAPMQDAPDSRTPHERTRAVSAPSQELPFPNLVRGNLQQGMNADTKPDIPAVLPTHDSVQGILASVHTSLAAQKQDREYYIQHVAQIAQRDGAWLEQERKKVRELEEELQRLRIGAEEERRAPVLDIQPKCEEARLAAEADHNSIVSHFKEFTTRIEASLQEGAAQRQIIAEHLNLKEQKRGEKDTRWAALENVLRKVVEDETSERLRAQKQREEEALRPGTEQVIEELRRYNIEHQRLLTDFVNASLAHSQQQHEEMLDVVRRTASEQIPFNIRKYLEEFSNALVAEVSTLLQEVGKLREDRRSLQHEIGYLLCLKSKYAPGGEFNTGWQPPTVDVRCTHPTAEPKVIGPSTVAQDRPVTISQHYPPVSAPPPSSKLGTLQRREKGHGKSRTSVPTDDTQAPSLAPIPIHHSTPFTVSNNITPAPPSSRTPRLYGPRAPETGITSLYHVP